MSNPLTPEESEIVEASKKHAKKIRQQFAKESTCKEAYPEELNPVSVFMAGSPGAGKTEASKALLDKFDGKVIRIDADEYRDQFVDCGYTGDNSWMFQPAVSLLVERVHDRVLKQKQSFLLDGTLTNQSKAQSNIERSLRKGRTVQILYVYQDPIRAWEFVKARESVEGRNIPLERFIEQYFKARECVNTLKQHFGAELKVDLLLQDRNNQLNRYKANIDSIDNHVGEKYTPSDLETLLKGG